MSVFIPDIDTAELYIQFLRQNNPKSKVLEPLVECAVSLKCYPAWQVFPCSFGAKNKEQESKTTWKIGRAKEWEGGGGGEERREMLFPSSPYPSFIIWLPFHFLHSKNQKSHFSSFLGLSVLWNHMELLATHAI